MEGCLRFRLRECVCVCVVYGVSLHKWLSPVSENHVTTTATEETVAQ